MDDIIIGIILTLLLFIASFFATYGILILINKIKSKNTAYKDIRKEKFFNKSSVIALIISVILTSAIIVFLLISENMAVQRAKEKGDEKLYGSKASIIFNNFINM